MNDQQSQLRQLIAKGKVQGYLTYAEVNDHLPSDIADPEQIEEFIGTINDLGIQVYETAPDDDSLITDSATVTADDEDAEEVAALASVDSEFGRTTDPVRMYMREMGSVELLTRADELKIAKRIEEGHQQLVKAISRSCVVVQDVLQSFDSISEEESGIRLTDLISGFVDLSEPEDLLNSQTVNDAVEVASPEDDLKGLNYDEVKEKIDLLRGHLQLASEAIISHGYSSHQTENAFVKLAEVFMEFKWAPQYLKKLSSIIPDGVASVREHERLIYDVFVKKAKMPRQDFIAAYTDNETCLDWIDQFLKESNPYASVVRDYEKEIRKAQKMLAEI